MKRFITDRVDPSVYKTVRTVRDIKDVSGVAVVGAGPAGLSAAHYLSLLGYKVTLVEENEKPGGMLESCIPAYRLPKDLLHREIGTLLDDENINLRCETALGSDITIDELFKDTFKAVFLAIGADKSQRLGLEREELASCETNRYQNAKIKNQNRGTSLILHFAL